ncbi:MAG: TraI/MobA(P) family conjugative relaxase [Ferrimonas sp.]
MIVRSIAKKKGIKGSIRKLVNYITSDLGKLQRVGEIQITNCYFSDVADIDKAVLEMQSVQDANRNIHATTDKTYHMLISFPEGERPTKEQLADIENRLCDSIGFNGHQRISVAHDDTANFHVHVAINRVHPVTLKVNNPKFDKLELNRVAAVLEEEHGLIRTNHEAKKTVSQGKAGDMEKHSGQESFVTWFKSNLQDDFNRQESWESTHKLLAEYGVGIKKRGNGLVFVANDGELIIKGSTVGRNCSLSALEKRLGAFQEPIVDHYQIRGGYEKKPLSKPKSTWVKKEEYQQLLDKFREHSSGEFEAKGRAFNKANLAKRGALEEAKKRYNSNRRIAAFGASNMKGFMYKRALELYKKEVAQAHADFKYELAKQKREYAKTTFADWLRREGENGNDLALRTIAAKKEQTKKSADTERRLTAVFDTATEIVSRLGDTGDVSKSGTNTLEVKGEQTLLIKAKGKTITMVSPVSPVRTKKFLNFCKAVAEKLKSNFSLKGEKKVVAFAEKIGTKEIKKVVEIERRLNRRRTYGSVRGHRGNVTGANDTGLGKRAANQLGSRTNEADGWLVVARRRKRLPIMHKVDVAIDKDATRRDVSTMLLPVDASNIMAEWRKHNIDLRRDGEKVKVPTALVENSVLELEPKEKGRER